MGLNVEQLITGLREHPPEAEVVVLYSPRMPLHEVKGVLSDENVNPLDLSGPDPGSKPVFVLLVVGHETPIRIGPRDLKRAWKLAR